MSPLVAGFAIWLAGKNGYEDSPLTSGPPVGTAEEAIERSCGLYVDDHTAWQPKYPRRTYARDHEV